MADSTSADLLRPTKFYKYRSMEPTASRWVERMVCNHEIYFAPASSFNDPFELRTPFSLSGTRAAHEEYFSRISRKHSPLMNRGERRALKSRVMKTTLKQKNLSATAATIQAQTSNHATSQLGIFCVTTKKDDILMWSHYGDSHKGICIEFDGHSSLMASAQEVKYSKHRPELNPLIDTESDLMNKGLLTKSRQWEYESEWRLFRIKQGPGIEEFRPANLTGIVIGAQAGKEVEDTIIRWANERVNPINIYKATVNKRTFTLDINQI